MPGCGGANDAEPQFPARSATEAATEPTPEKGFDPADPAYDVIPESDAAEQRLLARAGHRKDFRVPRSMVAGLKPGPMVHAAIVRVWNEVDPSDPRYKQLSPGQRALFALLWADYEILNGGFDQLWFNSSGYLAPDLVAAARRVGAREYADVFADAEALFPGGRIPRDRGARQRLLDGLDDDAVARLDDRYAEFQYRRTTALGLILGRYVRTHLAEFVADS